MIKFSLSKFIALAILIGGIGGIMSGEWPILGGILAVFGIIGALWDHFSSERQNTETEDFFEAQALLLAHKGIGNLYTEVGKLEWQKGGGNRAVARFKKALEINPADQEALISIGIIFALELAFEKWLGRKNANLSKEKLSVAKAYTMRGKALYPKSHEFCDILGIIYDTEGMHEQAREEFRHSGSLRLDPYWHLLMATSWAMSGRFQEEIAEIRLAIQKGAKAWIVDFYHGRALNDIGEYKRASTELKKALQTRKSQVQVLMALEDTCYFQGFIGRSAKYEALAGFVTLRRFPAYSLRRLGMSLYHYALHIVLGCSKRLWLITKHLPYLNKLHVRICSPAQPEGTLGWMLVRKGHYKSAEKMLRKACRIVPTSPYLWVNLCSCLALQGKRSKAIEKCAIAIRCAKTEPLLSQLRKYKENLEGDSYTGPKSLVEIKGQKVVQVKKL